MIEEMTSVHYVRKLYSLQVTRTSKFTKQPKETEILQSAKTK